MIRTALLWLLVFIAFQVQAYCDGPFNGKIPTPTELQKVLGEDYKMVNLCGANLTGADLSGAHLGGADLSEARLSGANLTGAHLSKAYLILAQMGWARLSKADLSWAILIAADLRWAILSGADLSGAMLGVANLIAADLSGANLIAADLSAAHLSGAHLGAANLSGAHLGGADLSGADLTGANLTGADLTGADLSGAHLSGADMAQVCFNPKPGKLPDITSFAYAENLDQMKTCSESMPALSELRESFKKDGFRDAERVMTYLRQRQQESWFSHVFFNWTCGYGLYPRRCLQILFMLVGLLSFVYLFALRRPGSGGIWAIWSTDRVDKTEGQDEPVRLNFDQPIPGSAVPRHDPLASLSPQPQVDQPGHVRRFLHFAARWLKAWGVALYFSLLSAFHFGWRDINVGNWISRVQPREYALRPTGWVRVLSGLQSLVSVYLVALWVLSYFGRPFE